MSERLKAIEFDHTWTQAAEAMYGVVTYTEKKHLTLVDVMGYTGHAFRININGQTADVAGPTAFDWEAVLSKGMKNLGFKTGASSRIAGQSPTPEQLTEAIGMIQDSIDNGLPVIAWDLFIPEFGLIYGYDDERRIFKAKDVTKDGELPYEKLGKGEVGELFVLPVTGLVDTDKYEALQGALEMIITHARNKPEGTFECEGYESGLAGYDAWMNVFRKRTADPFGNAYNVQHVSCARDFAWKFLYTLAAEWEGDAEADKRIRELALTAAGHYGQAAEALHPLADMFPFPAGGEPNKDEHAEFAIRQLEKAKTAEEQGVAQLEEMVRLLKVKTS